MKTIDIIRKTREYLDYIEEHVLNVQKAWKVIQKACENEPFIFDDYLYFTIQDAIDRHDFSKLSEVEFVAYRKQFFGMRGEVSDSTAFEKAWEHHKSNNPHHWENWTTISDDWTQAGQVHCVHMVVDWMAMGYKFNDTAREYYEKNKTKIHLPGWAVELIYRIFDAVEAVEL